MTSRIRLRQLGSAGRSWSDPDRQRRLSRVTRARAPSCNLRDLGSPGPIKETLTCHGATLTQNWPLGIPGYGPTVTTSVTSCLARKANLGGPEVALASAKSDFQGSRGLIASSPDRRYPGILPRPSPMPAMTKISALYLRSLWVAVALEQATTRTASRVGTV